MIQNDINMVVDNNPRLNNKYAPEIDNCGGSAAAKNIIFGFYFKFHIIIEKSSDIERRK